LLLAHGEREVPTEFFPADAAALQVALSLTVTPVRWRAGVLGSAHQINQEADRVAWLRAQWQTTTEDGESAHIAGAAALLGVPAIGVRVVSGTGAQAAAAGLALLEVLP
jgi:adenosylhomocysteine nucleosidase